MQFFLLFLFVSLFVFLFVLYWMGKDDLILLRRNIALEQLFNITGISLTIGLFTSRLGYVLLNPSKSYLNPLVFLVFPYFPGLSLFGGILGFLGYILYLTLQKKLPSGRLLDFFSLALLSAIPVGFMGSMFISKRQELLVLFILILVYIFITAVFFTYLYPKLLRNELKEGVIASIFAILFAVIQIASNFFLRKNVFWQFIGIEEVGYSLLFILGVFFLLQLLLKKQKH